jgi:hypothetical protein
MAWFGTKRVAFIPVYRPRMDAVPSDWEAQIQCRINFDPDSTGADVSLRSYIQTTSYGRADLEGSVLPRVEIDRVDVRVDALADRTDSLRDQGFNAGALVMLGGVGAGTAQLAGFWARFVMLEGVGVWAMELIHVLAGYGDLYANRNGAVADHPGDFNNMASAGGTHSSAYTKMRLGWLEPGAITRHVGRSKVYDLHSVGLAQPPPNGRHTGVQVGANTNFLVVEARKMVDQFDKKIPNEGVVVHQVETADIDPSPSAVQPVMRVKARSAAGTPLALVAGATLTSDSGVKVQAISASSSGFFVLIDDPTPQLVDRTAEYGTPLAARRTGPVTLAIRASGVGATSVRGCSMALMSAIPVALLAGRTQRQHKVAASTTTC